VAAFEELAERLAHASGATERIAAAERLAALDDSRVAPTLAKALADPDPAVRRRIRELLSQFCRSDSTGHLRLLLEEAERVASALTAEIQRLRGEAPEEPEPTTLEPMEPPAGFQGECALVRLTGGPLDVKRASRLVARRLRRPLFEVAREIHTTKGFLARGVPAEPARRVVHELAEAGVVVAAAPMEWLPQPLKVVRVREPRFASELLSARVLPAGQTSVAWKTVEIAIAGRVEVELEPGAIQEDWSPFTRPLTPRRERGGEQKPVYDYVLELFAGKPVGRLRFVAHDLDFRVMQRRLSGFAKVARMARELVRHVDRRRVNSGVLRLAELVDEDWEDLSFVSAVGFEDYVTWQRLLLVLGVPLPR